MRKLIAIAAPAFMLFVGADAHADTIVQMGILSGGEGTQNHVVTLNQFDTLSGTRQLNFVQLDFLTSVIGGYQTDGSGIPVHIHAELSAAYLLGGMPLSTTLALVDTIVLNTNVGSATVFNTDTDQVIFNQPADLVPWIGAGQIMLDATTFFDVYEDPPGIINFGGGGTARYTVTYDFTIIPAPGGLMAFSLMLLARQRRR